MSVDVDQPIDLVPADVCPVDGCGKPAVVDLVQALGALQDPAKSGTATIKGERGQYSYEYLELPALLNAVRGPLADHHLAVMQEVTNADRDVTVTTVLLHASGRQFRSPPLTLRSGGSAQDIGSASTYARRYTLAAMVGLAGAKDDDGQHAGTTPVRQAATPPAEPVKSGERLADRSHIHTVAKATDKSVKAMWTLLRKTGMDTDQTRQWVAAVLTIDPQWSTHDLTQEQVSIVIDRLKNEEQETPDVV